MFILTFILTFILIFILIFISILQVLEITEEDLGSKSDETKLFNQNENLNLDNVRAFFFQFFF